MENKKILFRKEKDKSIVNNSKYFLKNFLLTKNIVDFIKSEIANINSENKKLNWFQIIKIPLVALLITLLFSMPIFFINSVIIKIVLGIIAIKFFLTGSMFAKDWINIKKVSDHSSKLKINFLEKESKQEIENLKQLKRIFETKKEDINNYTPISRKKKIEDLKHKLILIQNYSSNKLKYLKLYNNSLLNSIIDFPYYTEDDIEFIKFIIQQDLKNNEYQKIKIKKLK